MDNDVSEIVNIFQWNDCKKFSLTFGNVSYHVYNICTSDGLPFFKIQKVRCFCKNVFLCLYKVVK